MQTETASVALDGHNECDMLELLGFVVEHTFACEAPRLCASHTVAQSTTEAFIDVEEPSASYYDHVRDMNPRRYQ